MCNLSVLFDISVANVGVYSMSIVAVVPGALSGTPGGIGVVPSGGSVGVSSASVSNWGDLLLVWSASAGLAAVPGSVGSMLVSTSAPS